MWIEGFAGFDEGFEAGEDAGPAVGGVGVGGVVLGPLVVRDGDFGGLGFGDEIDGRGILPTGLGVPTICRSMKFTCVWGLPDV